MLGKILGTYDGKILGSTDGLEERTMMGSQDGYFDISVLLDVKVLYKMFGTDDVNILGYNDVRYERT